MVQMPSVGLGLRLLGLSRYAERERVRMLGR
jgi:hypothetical protein